jgi:flagellar L-ring protein precursor FlgH
MAMRCWIFWGVLAVSACAHPQSLYVDGADPYAAKRRFLVGDLIQVSIDETLNADRESQQAVNKHATLSTETEAKGGASVSGHANLTQDGGGAGSTRRSDQLQAVLTVRIDAIEPDGTLEVEGQRMVDLDGEAQRLTLSGLLRPEDVALDRTASSQRLAKADLRVESHGTPRGSTKGWTRWLASLLDRTVTWP